MTITRSLGEYPNSVEEWPLWARSTAMQGLGSLASLADAAAAAAQPPSALTNILNAATNTITNLINPTKPTPATPSVAPAPKSNLPMILGIGAAGLLGLFLIMRKGGSSGRSGTGRRRRNPDLHLIRHEQEGDCAVVKKGGHGGIFFGKPNECAAYIRHQESPRRWRIVSPRGLPVKMARRNPWTVRGHKYQPTEGAKKRMEWFVVDGRGWHGHWFDTRKGASEQANYMNKHHPCKGTYHGNV